MQVRPRFARGRERQGRLKSPELAVSSRVSILLDQCFRVPVMYGEMSPATMVCEWYGVGNLVTPR